MLLENIHIKIATWSNYSRGSADGKTGPIGPGWPAGVMCGRDPVICGSDGKTCADQGDGSMGPPPPPGADCATCATKHQADLMAAGCTTAFVRGYCAVAPPPPNPPTGCIAQLTKDGCRPSATQLPCFGTHDYRPHDGGDCDYYCRTPSKAHGLYAENVHGLTLKVSNCSKCLYGLTLLAFLRDRCCCDRT